MSDISAATLPPFPLTAWERQWVPIVATSANNADGCHPPIVRVKRWVRTLRVLPSRPEDYERPARSGQSLNAAGISSVNDNATPSTSLDQAANDAAPSQAMLDEQAEEDRIARAAAAAALNEEEEEDEVEENERKRFRNEEDRQSLGSEEDDDEQDGDDEQEADDDDDANEMDHDMQDDVGAYDDAEQLQQPMDELRNKYVLDEADDALDEDDTLNL